MSFSIISFSTRYSLNYLEIKKSYPWQWNRILFGPLLNPLTPRYQLCNFWHWASSWRRLRILVWRLRVTGYGLRGYGLRGYGLRVTGYGSRRELKHLPRFRWPRVAMAATKAAKNICKWDGRCLYLWKIRCVESVLRPGYGLYTCTYAG